MMLFMTRLLKFAAVVKFMRRNLATSVVARSTTTNPSRSVVTIKKPLSGLWEETVRRTMRRFSAFQKHLIHVHVESRHY